jgi:hypothetical protein
VEQCLNTFYDFDLQLRSPTLALAVQIMLLGNPFGRLFRFLALSKQVCYRLYKIFRSLFCVTGFSNLL